MSLKITIITACLNSVDVIQTALESVLIQTWTDLEYLVVDGGSTDGTLDVIRAYELRFCGRMRWASEPDRGFYDAMNKGIRLATGDIVGLLNADDFYVHEHVLERVAGIFSNVGSTPNEQIDAVYADVRFVSASNLQKEIRHYSGRYWQPWMLRWGSTPPPSTFFCRRKCFEDLGGYKIDYKISADHELLIRFLWNASIKTHYIPEIIINMRMGGVSTRGIRSTIIINREAVRANRENGRYTNVLMMYPKYAIKIFEFIIPFLKRSSSLWWK